LDEYFKDFIIERNDIGNAGTVASLTKRALKKRGFSRDYVKKVTIGVYEAEINVVIHSYGGIAQVTINDEMTKVVFNDNGPGIEDIDKALTRGYSTASKYAIENGFGAGMGLPNIKDVADEMLLDSSPEGTNLSMMFYIKENNYIKSSDN
jgi:anti-sigma regulatory factor (Ser/Thr protein kinase)